MSPKKEPEISTAKWLWSKVRYGLVFQGLRNRLSRIGLEFRPYYWVLEGADNCEIPKIPGDISEYSLEFLSREEIKLIGRKARGYTEEMLLGHLEKGKKCIGLKHKGEIAAFMWLDFEECNFTPAHTRLKEDEVYLFSMYTMEKFRGRNLAPYLRYKSYEILRKLGRDKFYSISEYFNYSTIKFKNKLNARHLKLILYIELFKKFRRSFTLRKY